jgi:hypothetical protein
VYLGLVHEDEADTQPFLRRVQGARRHLREFGIGGVCGYGRLDPSELPSVLKMHTDCAAELARIL